MAIAISQPHINPVLCNGDVLTSWANHEGGIVVKAATGGRNMYGG
ncbi:hypothetical protein D1BOALGB6SA_7909 [Olavius sp. associated proteobacterium Delta 1]|nr:hypothetical protein D1BOALGB6SA_7909 [Olavius sp. associated proteobacterium Delta 1]